MKKALLLLVCALALIQTTLAAETNQPSQEVISSAGLFQVDVGESFRSADLENFEPSTHVGLNYFPWQNVGFGLEANTQNTDSAAIDRIGANLRARYPLKLGLAPEFGIGYDIDLERGAHGRGGSECFAFFGLEKRIWKQFSIVGEVRGVRPFRQSESEYAMGTIKLRFSAR